MVEMLEALFGDTMAIDENGGGVELDLRKDGALIVNGSRLFPDGSWGSAGELIGEPVVPLSEVREALEEADQALTAWHADEPFYDPGSDSSEPFTQDAEFVTFIGHAVRDALAAFPSDSEEGKP